MWTVKLAEPPVTDWEAEEQEERLRHAAWLVMHGAEMSEVTLETGLRASDIRRRINCDKRKGKTS